MADKPTTGRPAGRAGRATGRSGDQTAVPAAGGPVSGSGRAGGREAARRGPGSRRGAQVPYLIVLAAAGAGLVWLWRGGGQPVRGGTLAMAGALFVAALARLVLPEGWAGMLASRGRFIDVVTLAALAIGLLVAGLLLSTPS